MRWVSCIVCSFLENSLYKLTLLGMFTRLHLTFDRYMEIAQVINRTKLSGLLYSGSCITVYDIVFAFGWSASDAVCMCCIGVLVFGKEQILILFLWYQSNFVRHPFAGYMFTNIRLCSCCLYLLYKALSLFDPTSMYMYSTADQPHVLFGSVAVICLTPCQ